MIIHEVEQGSEEWLKLRLGKFTGSKANDLLMKETNKGYQNLIYQIAYERLTNEPIETYKNEWMQYGNEMEDVARGQYQIDTFNLVKQVGFIEKDEWIGCSPDGLVGENGIIEIKCVKWNTQISYLLDQKVPNNYLDQIQFNLWVSEREWCDFYSWHPKLNSFLMRIKRNEDQIKYIKSKIEEISKQDVLNLMEKLK